MAIKNISPKKLIFLTALVFMLFMMQAQPSNAVFIRYEKASDGSWLNLFYKNLEIKAQEIEGIDGSGGVVELPVFRGQTVEFQEFILYALLPTYNIENFTIFVETWIPEFVVDVDNQTATEVRRDYRNFTLNVIPLSDFVAFEFDMPIHEEKVQVRLQTKGIIWEFDHRTKPYLLPVDQGRAFERALDRLYLAGILAGIGVVALLLARKTIDRTGYFEMPLTGLMLTAMVGLNILVIAFPQIVPTKEEFAFKIQDWIIYGVNFAGFFAAGIHVLNKNPYFKLYRTPTWEKKSVTHNHTPFDILGRRYMEEGFKASVARLFNPGVFDNAIKYGKFIETGEQRVLLSKEDVKRRSHEFDSITKEIDPETEKELYYGISAKTIKFEHDKNLAPWELNVTTSTKTMANKELQVNDYKVIPTTYKSKYHVMALVGLVVGWILMMQFALTEFWEYLLFTIFAITLLGGLISNSLEVGWIEMEPADEMTSREVDKAVMDINRAVILAKENAKLIDENYDLRTTLHSRAAELGANFGESFVQKILGIEEKLTPVKTMDQDSEGNGEHGKATVRNKS